MKKREVDHVLRAAGRITGEKQFIIIGSQSLHGKYPDLPDDLVSQGEGKPPISEMEARNLVDIVVLRLECVDTVDVLREPAIE